MVISLYKTGLLNGFFNGNAENAVKAIFIYLKGFFRPLIGLFFKSIKVCIFVNVSLKINLLRSKVPKILLAHLNSHPFTFSNNNAGPCIS